MEPGGAGGAENPIPEDDEFQDDDEEFEDDDEEEEFEDDDEEDLDDDEDPEETVINQSPTPVEQWQGEDEDEGEGEDEQQQQHQQTGYYPPSFQQRLQAGVPAQEALRGAELAADLLEAAGVGDLEVLYLGEPFNFNELNVPNVPPPPPPPPRGLDEDLDDDDDDLDDDEDLDEEPEPEVIDLHEEIDQVDAEIDHHMDGDEGVAELDQPIGYVEIDLVQDEGAAEPEPEPEDELPPEPEDELPPVELDQPMGDIEIDLIDLEQDEGGAVSEEPEVELAPPPPPRVPTNPRPFLHMLVGRNVSVRLKWGQVYRGILKSTDAYMNLELQGSVQESVVPGSEPTILGDILIRHNNVMYIREI